MLLRGRHGGAAYEVAAVDEVGDQDRRNGPGQAQIGGDLGEGQPAGQAVLHHPVSVRVEPVQWLVGVGDQQRGQVQGPAGGDGPPSGGRVGPNHPPALPASGSHVVPRAVRARADSAGRSPAMALIAALAAVTASLLVMCWVTETITEVP